MFDRFSNFIQRFLSRDGLSPTQVLNPGHSETSALAANKHFDPIVGGDSRKANTAGQDPYEYNSFFNHSPEDRASGKLHYGAVYGVKIPFESLEHVKKFMKIYGRLQQAHQAHYNTSRAVSSLLSPNTDKTRTTDFGELKAADLNSEKESSSYFERSPYDFGVWVLPHYPLRRNKAVQPTQNHTATAQISGESRPVIAFKDGYLYTNIGDVDLKLVLSSLISQATGSRDFLKNYQSSVIMFKHLMSADNHNHTSDPKSLQVLRGAFMLDINGDVLQSIEPEPSISPSLPSAEDQQSLHTLLTRFSQHE